MSAHVRRIAILSAASPQGWRLYPVGAAHHDRIAATSTVDPDAARPRRPDVPPITPAGLEAGRRASHP
ncbi:MAG TPA: hypothetical protein VGN78_12495 [Solirubrobacteraceae bacterium]|jgi:hypothetical protein|nr:hypothetical protein [Solirubrobacteraceae bacterium]